MKTIIKHYEIIPNPKNVDFQRITEKHYLRSQKQHTIAPCLI
jgi:hypothetical protein